eukprot:1152083-Pelagomonas_calceolata.AAC.6
MQTVKYSPHQSRKGGYLGLRHCNNVLVPTSFPGQQLVQATAHLAATAKSMSGLVYGALLATWLCVFISTWQDRNCNFDLEAHTIGTNTHLFHYHHASGCAHNILGYTSYYANARGLTSCHGLLQCKAAWCKGWREGVRLGCWILCHLQCRTCHCTMAFSLLVLALGIFDIQSIP